MVEKNMVTLTEKTIIKSRSGVYSDTSENRRKHRVGQKYGVEKQPEDSEKTEKKETDPAKELEAVNKVIAAINEGKLNLPAAELIKLSEKKQKLEAAKKQAEKINAGVKANEEKKNVEGTKETQKEPEILQWGGEKNPDFRKGTKEQFQNLYKKIEGQAVDLGYYGKGKVVGMKVRDDGYTQAIVQTSKGSLLEAPYSEVLEGKVENMFGGSSLKRGLTIDPKALSSEKEKSKTEESSSKKYAEIDIKEAKKELVGKEITFKDYWDAGEDAKGKIEKVRLYGKEKQPVAEVLLSNGTEVTISLEQLDKRKARQFEIEFGGEKKEEPKNKEKLEQKPDKASDPIYQIQQKKKENSKNYDKKREEVRQKYDKEADEIRSKIDKLYESDNPDASKQRKELWDSLKVKTNEYDKETTRLKDEYEAAYQKLDAAEDKLYDQQAQKEVTDLRNTEKWLKQEIDDITKKIEGITNKTIQISPREKPKVFQRLEKLKSSLKDTQEKLKALGGADGGAKPVESKKDIQKQGSEAKSEEPEIYTRVKFDDVPNSGKVNLKKYLSEKMKRSADETWGDISKIDTKGLQKMEKGLIEDFNRQFDDLPKSRRAEKLYAIIKVKGELAKRGKESQTTETGKDSDKSEDKVGGVGVKDIFNDIRLLNPSQSTISSLGTFVSSQNQQIADSERQRVMKYLPKDSLAYKIAFDADKFTDKQLWVIAYELNKNKNFKEDLAGRLEEYRRQEEFERARKRAKREAKRNRGI